MDIFDVHTHLQDRRYVEGYGAVIERAKENSVTKIMCCGLHENDWDRVKQISREYENVYPAFGIHPWFIENRSYEWLDILEEKLVETESSPVGEVGLDGMVAGGRMRDEQEKVFIEQLKLAKKLDRPLNIHCRKAWGRITQIIDKEGLPERCGVIHSFSGSHEMVKVLQRKGLLISFSGSVTKKANKKVRKALMEVENDMLLVETDSPDINPEGVEGLNEPSHIHKTIGVISELRGESFEETAFITHRNAVRLFG